ncbi:coiled-coil domain-containing protein 183 [Nothoprocta perdicaria]|uniref:coiled-coil domain-containing protein 183 n=1 Tax=Nothoprocta perdicaria TaxID=30464 RepID=UPI000E1B9CA7|nr:coiled-coil domain-containing protein 183 [Nothoprocta perdicaria]
MQDQRADINQQIQELRTIISLQEQGKKLFMQSAEEKLIQNRGLLPCLRGTVRDDINALGIAEKQDQIIISEACRAQKHLDIILTKSTVEMAREKLQNDVFDRVNVCNMLLYELRQRDRALEELQRQLQHLTEAEIGDKQQQAQMQMIRQLENNIEKTLMKVRTGQKVTTLYLAVRDVLKKELAHLPLRLNVLDRMVEVYQGELKGMELMALDAFKATDTAKMNLANLESQFLMERNLRDHSLAAQKERIDKIRLKDASERHRRAQAKGDLAVDFPPLTSQETMGAKLEATKSQIEHQAQVTAEVEKVKSAVQCSRLWDIAGKLLAQQKSTVDLQQHIKECEEKKVVLKDKLKELELKQAELKFHQPPSAISSRKLEEELKINLQQEEARLEQMQAQMLKNQELLLMFENGIDNLFIRLYGITVPDQDVSAEPRDTDEKLQHCEKKLLHLAQLVTNLPAQQSLDEDNETFVKVRNFLEKTTKEEPQNLRISLEDIGMGVQDAFDFADKDHGHVLTREEIKKQGLRIIESKMKSGKKKQQSFPKGF